MSEKLSERVLGAFAGLDREGFDWEDCKPLADEVADLEAKLEVARTLLAECRKAISNVPDKAIFGIGGGDGVTHWYLADELLAKIAAQE